MNAQGQQMVQPKVAPGPLAPPRPTEAEARAQKRHSEYLADDCKRVCNADITRPFSNLQDAVERLLPFHILGALGEPEADMEDTQGQLLCSRSQAWSDVMQRHAIEFTRQTVDLNSRLRKLEQQRQRGGAVVDRLVISRFLLEDSRERLQKERARPANYVSSDEEEADAERLEEMDVDEAQQQQQPAEPRQAHIKDDPCMLDGKASLGIKSEWPNATHAAAAVPAALPAATASVVKEESSAGNIAGTMQGAKEEDIKAEAPVAEQQEAKQEPKEEEEGPGKQEQEDEHALGGFGDFGDFDDEGLEEYVEED